MRSQSGPTETAATRGRSKSSPARSSSVGIVPVRDWVAGTATARRRFIMAGCPEYKPVALTGRRVEVMDCRCIPQDGIAKASGISVLSFRQHYRQVEAERAAAVSSIPSTKRVRTNFRMGLCGAPVPTETECRVTEANHGGRCGRLKPFLKQQSAIYFSASRQYCETTVSGPWDRQCSPQACVRLGCAPVTSIGQSS
jgi:hypothetical protein